MPSPTKKLSELARSPFWKTVYTLQEVAAYDRPTFTTLDERLAELCEKTHALLHECEEKFESLHDNFKESSKLPGRIEVLEDCLAALQDIDVDYAGPDSDTARQEWVDEQWQEAIEALNAISCD